MEQKTVKTGLVLEGGAMRGMFTCGVLDVFMENGITFDGAAGISAGAVFGCNFKSHQIGRAVRYNKQYGRDPRYCSIRSLVRTGDLYGAKFCYDDLPNRLDPFDQETFRKDPMEFYIGATDMNTGHAVFHLCKDMGRKDLQWMRASASMPLVSRIVRVDGFELLDGGIVTSVPYGFMERREYNRNVIVLTQPAGYCKEPVKMALFKVMLRKYPKVVEAMAVRHEMYNRQMEEISQREASGESLVIRPPESLGIKRTENDPDQLERVYQIGRREAERRLPDVRTFLGGCAKA
ncbi:MAG: patatin family protein [Lachnospiraceae bacterium]|nr:patatin family protein [Lachnospiraceae bacterium]